MNQQLQRLMRIHHFYVGVAKFLFYHPKYGIVSVRDPIKIKDATKHGLSPLILYGLTVAGLPIRWMSFTSFDQPRAFKDVLLEGWCNATGLRGRPDILLVNRHIVAACPDLPQEMKDIGVHVEVANTRDKSLPSSLRSAQNASPWLRRKGTQENLSLNESILKLCQYAQYEHNFSIDRKNNRKIDSRVLEWLDLPAQIPETCINFNRLDWRLGKWLSSWESSVPPYSQRYFNFNKFDGVTWLLTGKKILQDLNSDNFCFDDSYDNTAKIVKNLVTCWPNSPNEIAKKIGVTLKKLQWFMSGKASLDTFSLSALQEILGFTYDGYSCVGTGPYVLIAKKPQALKDAYGDISQGGNAYPYEVTPSQGMADLSWRYILINNYGGSPSIVMVPRGSKISEHLPELFLNYGEIKSVPQEFYRCIVSTCALACREPTANIPEMRRFVEIYKQYSRGAYFF